MELKDVVLCSALRTPLGSFGGTLRNFKVYDLGAMVLRETIKRGNISPEIVDEVIVSHCRQAGRLSWLVFGNEGRGGRAWKRVEGEVW